ncbi:RNA polymerase sigma factor SigJ [Subtercola endophyticus]|uniref:RNA polymerase sigma factor SigJ n=1 Tax=Subtercola endophyticus TaxID=2895559 RepID=UPI0028BE5381|nr:RNA polymerase sigma factor SigJ [Subtercola endophyticus]
MSDNARNGIDDKLIGERRHLLALAFRMLGTISEAEDAVQETYTRWYRMPQPDRDAVVVVAAWLTRTTGRICLDMLGSARARRERYIGPWLPEPLPLATFDARADDPLDRVALDDSVSTALLVVLELMTPAERVAFVLHDVFAVPFPEVAEIVGRSPASCRQLATSARARVHQHASRIVPRREHDQVVRAFAQASRSGDLDALIRALDPNVVLRSDGGGIVTAARNPVYGAERVGRFLLGSLRKREGVEVIEQETNDGLGFALWDEGRIVGVVTLEVASGLITNVRMVLNPEKLSLWN